jgi:hypothetical protein
MIGFLPHAQAAMAKRQIGVDLVERALEWPDWSDDDPNHLGRRRSYKTIPERDDRILRVIHWMDGSDIMVLTVFLDRNALKARRS